MSYKNIILLFLLSFLPLIDLFHPGLPITHDGQDHVARIANFYQNLADGNIIPRWAPNLNWGYGHPILMFLYPLPSYIASFFHFLGFSLIDSLKIVFGIAFIASGFAMYIWIKEFLGEEAGVVAGALYMFAPYRFVDLYVRGAIGEHVAFVFPPLIFYFLIKLSKQYSYWHIVGGSLSFAALILSHNAITLMFLPLIFLYIFYLSWISSFKKYFIRHTLYVILLAFGLAGFFWIPAFFEGKYTLRDIVTKGAYVRNFSEVKDFLYSQWSYGGTGQFTVQIGILQWLMIVTGFLAMFVLRHKRDRRWILTFGLLVIFFSTLFLMTSSSNIIWETITMLQKFQFPWRLLSVMIFVTAVLSAITASVATKKIRLLFVFLIISLTLFFNNYWHAKSYLYKEDSFFKNVYFGTTDTGESAPIWSVRFMEHPPKARIEVIGGDAEIKELHRMSTKHIYEIHAKSPIAQIRENTLYFPGWIVEIDGKPTTIEFQSQVNRGVLTFFLEKGKHTVIVSFHETKLRLIANVISVVSLAALLFWSILGKRNLWQDFR